ncbi:exosortase B [Rubrivivax albus]|uniref:Exosortase B n=1 Tax=Rubrivivax albus TaxID=2499835 RepID=A0A3S2VZ40_9BURK|nr:exosortase B [Rubrivivax albus]RVT53667.1 exosortase B [Rubrivivax albus]
MSVVRDTTAARQLAEKRPLIPPGADLLVLGLLLLAFVAMYAPSYLLLAERIWPTDEQGHGPIILAVSLWLLFSKRYELAALESKGQPAWGYTVLGFGVLLYAVGRSQYIMFFEIVSQIVVLAGLVLLFRGRAGLRLVWFPLFFLLFMVPLPGSVVASVTGPLKSAVSAVAASLLHSLGYPLGRSGVVLTVGPYQLLVADACAGLNSMFTLEALGLLYMNLMGYTNAVRNVVLAVLIIPISFAANIVRVMILVLVTYHFGDEAGQGFVHDFAGMVLFLVGLVLMLATDKLLALFFRGKNQRSGLAA